MRCRRARNDTLTAAALLSGLLALSVQAHASERETAPQARGALVYSTYCALCHGEAGKGDGRAAVLQKTRPADLTISTRSDAYRLQIIRGGGTAVKRSESMPAWNQVLSSEQIDDLIVYLRSLASRGTLARREASHQAVTGATPVPSSETRL